MCEENKKPTAIFLVGMMAAGKTTVGKYLAQRLGWDFYDNDEEVEKQAGMTVSDIFAKEGEWGFRSRETAMLARLTSRPGSVLATGGGVPMFEINRKILRRGLVIQLMCRVSDVLERTRGDDTRPLLRSADPAGRIRLLMLEREPVYQSVSDIDISTSRISPNEVIDEILSLEKVKETIREFERIRAEMKE